MLYLAEVQKKSGFMGAKTELKLLARQQSENNWNALPGDEVISADAANDFNSGVLVVVDLDNNRQIQGVQDATRQLIGILKSFSKMKEKFRSQEEEIEGWKQSLIYQSQELTRREVDMELRAEELQHWEAESHKIAQQRQEFEQTRDQILELKEQIERDRIQLEEGWGKLQLAQQELEHLQASHSMALSDDQVQQIETLLGQLESQTGSSPEALATVESLEQRLFQAWQTLEGDRTRLGQLQGEVDSQAQQVAQSWQNWEQQQVALRDHQSQLHAKAQQLKTQQSMHQFVVQTLESQGQVNQMLTHIQAQLDASQPVDLAALWEMPMDELSGTVERLRQELSKLQSFVNDQEEELTLQQQSVQEMRQRMNAASDYDRLTLQADLEEEEQHYQLLNETLEGQRQSLLERASVLEQHQQVLDKRRATAAAASPFQVDLKPALGIVAGQLTTQQQMVAQLQAEIDQANQTLAQDAAELEQRRASLATERDRLRSQEAQLQQQRTELDGCRGRLEGYEQLLQPLQDQVNTLKAVLGGSGNGHNGNGSGASQAQAIAELKTMLMALGEKPEMAI